jgi:hypothetical protein
MSYAKFFSAGAGELLKTSTKELTEGLIKNTDNLIAKILREGLTDSLKKNLKSEILPKLVKDIGETEIKKQTKKILAVLVEQGGKNATGEIDTLLKQSFKELGQNNIKAIDEITNELISKTKKLSLDESNDLMIEISNKMIKDNPAVAKTISKKQIERIGNEMAGALGTMSKEQVSEYTEKISKQIDILQKNGNLTESFAKATKDDINIVKKVMEENAEKASKEVTSDSVKRTAGTYIKDAASKAGSLLKSAAQKIGFKGAAILGVGGYFAISALKDYYDKEGKQFKIKNIKNKTGSETDIMITFEPGEKISKYDKVEISQTNSVPIISPGLYEIKEIISSTSIVIKHSEKITTEGTQGDMILRTTLENQLLNKVDSSLEKTVDLAKKTTDTAFDALFTPFKSIFDQISQLFNISADTVKWSCLGSSICICCIIIIVGLVTAYMSFR